MARNSTKRGAWWRVPSGVERILFFCAPQRESAQLFQHRIMWYHAGFKECNALKSMMRFLFTVSGRRLVLSSSLNWLTCASVTRTNRIVFKSTLHV